jgi:ketosteroid isomerase-like protein
VLLGGTEYRGKDQLRDWLTRIVRDHLYMTIDEPVVDGNSVTTTNTVWADSWRSLGVAPLRNRLSLTVVGGKITNFDVQVTPEYVPRIEDATAKRGVVQALFAALNAGDLEGTAAQLDPDVVIVGAQGDVIRGLAGARDYYARLIGTHIQLTPFGEWYVQSDRVIATYGLAANNLRAAGIIRGETWGAFHVRNGKITHIEARFSPNTAEAIETARREGRL